MWEKLKAQENIVLKTALVAGSAYLIATTVYGQGKVSHMIPIINMRASNAVIFGVTAGVSTLVLTEIGDQILPRVKSLPMMDRVEMLAEPLLLGATNFAVLAGLRKGDVSVSKLFIPCLVIGAGSDIIGGWVADRVVRE